MPNANTTEENWVNETPDESGYSLYMYSGTGDNLQEMDLTREEYIDLKESLARRRGFSGPAGEVTQPVANRITEHTCSDILTSLEGLEALGNSHLAYHRLLEGAEPAELRWLADVLNYRADNPAARLDECFRFATER